MAATNYYSVVQQLYISYFGRPADPQGQQNFAGQLAALDPSGTLTNTTALNTYVQAHPASAIATLVGSFNAQPESVALYGSGTTTVEIARFVSAIYNNVLHRDPDIDGANFWIAQIVSGGLSKANAALAITEGALANTSAQGRIDAAQVDHTLAIGADFTAALDTVTKVNAYAGDAAATQARDLLRAVTPRTETVEFHGYVVALIDALVVAATVHVALTTGVDNFAGTDANDVFSGVVSGTPGASTFNAGDAINGGAGANRLELSDSSGALDLSIATVANIQTAAIDSTGGLANNAADLRGWSGLRAASVLLKSAAVQQLSVANTTALTVTNNAGVSTSGGATVNATVVATAPLSENNVAIAGDALTAVTVAGGNRVTIDNNGKGTLTSVSLAGAHGDALLTSAALTKVTLAGTSHAVTIVNATVGHTESLTLNGVVAGVITDDVAKALVVNTIGAASAGVFLQAATATTVTFTGDKALAVTLNAAHVSAVTLSSTGGFSGSFAGIDGAATITATTFSGPNTVALGAGQSYLGSIGVDHVSIVAAPSVPLRGGDGGATDVLLMNAGGGLDANANARITGFETLALGSLAAGDYNAAGFSHLEVNSGAAGAVSFSGVGRNTDLAVTGAAGQPLTYALLNAAGTTDGLNLALRADSAANASNTLNAVNIENITIITSDTGTSVGHAAFAGQLTLNDSALVNLNVRGNMGLHLVDLNDTAFSRVDASGITAGGFIWTTGALSATLIQASIIGSASGGDVINAASVVGKGVTIAEKAGTNAITGSSTVASSLLGGTGADTIVGGIGNDSLYDGGGADVMTGGAGADHFVFGGSTAMIVQALGASGVNTATDGQTTESTSTFDVIMGQFAGNKLDLGNAAITATATSASAGAAGTMKLQGINLQALVDNTAVFALGFYDPGARSFIYAVNGVDSALTYDADASAGTHFETIILMGYQANAFATTIAAGVITL